MSFWKKAGLGLGGIIAFLGRGVINAHYQRGVQYATDAYIRYVGGALLAAIVALLLNFVFVVFRMHGAQTVLAILLFPVSLYYLFAPKIAIPLTALASGNIAGAEGDQANIWLIRDGVKKIASMAGIVLFWIEVYIFATMATPFDLYPEFFWVLHIFIVAMLAALMTGKVEISPKFYDKAFWTTAGLLVAGVLVVLMFREQLGPWWTKHTASNTSRIIAEKNSESIRKADEKTAEWIAKHVHIDEETGRQVIIVDGKAVDAKPYIQKMEQHRDEIIQYVTSSASKTDAQKEKSPSTGLMGEWDKFYQLKTTDPTLFWVILIIAHIPLIWLIKWAWGKRNADEDKAEVKKAETASSSNLIPIVLLLTPFVIYYLYFYDKTGGQVIVHPQVAAATNSAIADASANTELGIWKATLTAADNDPPFTDREFDVMVDKAFADRMNGINQAVTPVGFAFAVSGVNDAGTYHMQNIACDMPRIYDISKKEMTKCSGNWTNGDRNGSYEVYYNDTERNLYLSSEKGLIEMKLSQG